MNTQTKTKELPTPKKDPISSLKRILQQPGVKKNIIYTILKHVSASGMTREISFYIAGKDGIINIDWYIKEILGYKFGKRGLKVQGWGWIWAFR